MRRFWIKLALFFCLWYEIAAELHLGGDMAFLVAAGIVVLGWYLLRLAGQLLGMLGPNVQRLLIGTLVWLGLFWWFAPAVLKAQPLTFVLLGALGIAVLGARLRRYLSLNRQRFDRQRVRKIGATFVVLGLAVLGVCFQLWGSLWPLAGYVLLPGLPLLFGWQMAGHVGTPRQDARFGDTRWFRDAGLSEER